MTDSPNLTLQERIKKSSLLQRLWDYSGCRFIYHKFIPLDPSNPSSRRPSTGFLWLVGIYVALFGIASQRYENRLDRIESRLNGIYAQLSSKNWKQALERIPAVQRMVRPQKPELFNPYKVFCSFICVDVPDQETVNSLKDITVSLKGDLFTVILNGIDLRGADLRGSNLRGADLSGSNLSGSNLRGSNLRGADLSRSNLSGSNLRGANLSRAFLTDANLTKANLLGATLNRATLNRSNLSETNLIGAFFLETDFKDANFNGTVLSGASFGEKDPYTEVILRKAKGLTQEQIDRSFIDGNTVLLDSLKLKLSKRTKTIRSRTELYQPLVKDNLPPAPPTLLPLD